MSGEEIPYEELFYRKNDAVELQARHIELVDRCYADTAISLTTGCLKIGEDTFDPEKVLCLEVVADRIVLPREAMGPADATFMAAIGAFLGWPAVLFSLAASSFLGSVVGGTAILLKKRDWSSRIPYGPYIAAGAVLWMFCGCAGCRRICADQIYPKKLLNIPKLVFNDGGNLLCRKRPVAAEETIPSGIARFGRGDRVHGGPDQARWRIHRSAANPRDDYTRRDRYEDGLRIDERLARMRPQDPMVHYNLACSYSLTQQCDLALESLNTAINLGYSDFAWMVKDPDLKNLRDHAGYKKIQAKVRCRPVKET